MDVDYYEGPMNTDAAEAIMIGHYAVNDKLLWSSQKSLALQKSTIIPTSDSIANSDSDIELQPLTQREGMFSLPLIERYSNGNVVLPPRTKTEKKI